MKKKVDSRKSGNRLHLAPTAVPTVGRKRSARPVSSNPFSAQLAELVTAVGLPQSEYAEILSGRLGRPVSQVVLSNWLRGRSPRRLTAEHDPESEVLAAARDILERQGRQPARISPGKVQRTIQAWQDKGLTLNQVRVAGEVAETLVRDWAAGKVSVTRPRWEAFCLRVNSFVELVAESQLAWKVETEVRNRIARAKKMVGKPGIPSLAVAYERLRAAELIAEASSTGPTDAARRRNVR